MTQTAQTSIHQAFGDVYDPRQQGKITFVLTDIIFMAICAIVCGANDWTQVAAFVESQKEWFMQFLKRPGPIPSHDTFGTVFGLIDSDEFSAGFATWSQLLLPSSEGKHIAIDGKVLKGSQDRAIGRRAIDVVSAFMTDHGLTLAQQKVDEKSNEITAIPHLLRMLNLQDCVVTIDAMGCQKEIVKQICDSDGDAIISLKGNQGKLHEDTKEMFNYFQQIDFKDVPHSYFKSVSKGHGRIEVREAWAFSPADYAEYFRTLKEWPTLKSLVMVRSQRHLKDKIEEDVRFFISTLDVEAKEQLGYIRQHWHIENKLHWVLDVAFREDRHRSRIGNSAANFSTLRHFATNLLRLNKSKGGIETKRLRCAWDTKFRLNVLKPLLEVIV